MKLLNNLTSWFKRSKSPAMMPVSKRAKKEPMDDFKFFVKHFRSNDDWEQLYDNRKAQAVYRTKLFTSFHNRVYNTVMKYGTKEEQRAVLRKLNKSV